MKIKAAVGNYENKLMAAVAEIETENIEGGGYERTNRIKRC
jgi:hypothetical protein